MESSETHEPSYYEVALTNRQVLVAFVVLLTCLLGAFLSGVWVGRGAEGVVSASNNPPPRIVAPEPVEQLTFFSGREPGARSAQTTPTPGQLPPTSRAASSVPPAAAPPPPVVAEDPATEAMRRTLEAEMEAHREPSVAAEPEPEPTTRAAAAAPTAIAQSPTEPGARTSRRPADVQPAATPGSPTSTARVAPAPPAPTVAPTARGSFWIQVYSSSNGARAQEIATSLRRAGFSVLLAELPKAGAPATHRVRVGPYETRAKAEPTATKLRRDHRLDTWITDTP